MADAPPRGTFEIDPERSRLEFVARHLLVSTVRGRATGITGHVVIADPPDASSAEASIPVTTITTGDRARDESVRGPDILDVGHHPDITFASTAVHLRSDGSDRFRLDGDLTIKGLSRPVSLEVTYRGSADGISFSAKTTLNRERWGLLFHGLIEAGGVVVGKTFGVTVDVVATRQ